jgi:hypothetical protein
LSRLPQTPTSPSSPVEPPRASAVRWVDAVDKPHGNSVDEAARGRLRQAILAEDGDEEQLDGVIRMLGEKTHAEDRLPLFGKARADRRPG